ncbi:MAG: UvrD-helicase domain-containing protein [Betaproteobacteria bacterium]|nr:UvrD-helicase domain-containing protein [Betaproteobacteria bacterium]
MTGIRVRDADVRERALDAERSFIVQAPAGSGKTGLIIQRYLRLLANVRRPEEILAITFTRKAAGEMKRRVLAALEAARADPAGEAPAHERRTRELAIAALAQDARQGWRLAENPARLRIQTIDSFNASLTRQLPLLARLGPQPALVEDASDLFREAALRTLAMIAEGGERAVAVRRLLVHVDGDLTKAAGLIADLLRRRDQWLGRDWSSRIERGGIERAFAAERARMAGRARAGLEPVESELVALAAYAAGELARLGADSPILACAGLSRLPSESAGDEAAWRGLVELLLTRDAKGVWRRKVDKRQGFATKKDGGTESMKDAMASLLERLAGSGLLRDALADLRGLPPESFTDAQWEALEAVVALLPFAAAHLLALFGERGEVDHAEIAAGAVRALGDENDPTDLLLALDERLSHLLVDEFQDTSRTQWALLAALTAGWSPGDGRTVFAVGDPMQSIYRFREADVGLFLRAWREGLPRVPLATLTLTTNFRSQSAIVAWVNATFARVLPGEDDESEGAVRFSASDAFHEAMPGDAVEVHAWAGDDADAARDEEAARVVDIVREARCARPGGSIAVLVRNRSHLDRIVPALRGAGIAFCAVDIEGLAERQGVLDLVALARALAHPADRVAWLSVLRAPWCGLTLAALQVLGAHRDRTVREALADGATIDALPASDRARALRAKDVLDRALAARLRASLRARVETVWIELGGPACLDGEAALEDAETFFDRLDAIEEAGDLADSARLAEQLEDLYGTPDLSSPDAVQLLTIHKSKGLEFSTVIVPGLDRAPRAGDAPLFRWKTRADGALLMAPIAAAGTKGDAAYDYLRTLDAREEGHEAERLLYVALTRAEHRLHLLGRVGVDGKPGQSAPRAPASRSLLGKAWEVLEPAFAGAGDADRGPAAAANAIAIAPASQSLRRLRPGSLDVVVAPPPVASAPKLDTVGEPVEFSWAGETARHVGTVAHRWLQRIAQDGLSRWDTARIAALARRVSADLTQRGVPASERESASRRVLDVLGGAIADERGRWVLAERDGAACEVRVKVLDEGRVRLLVMDRVFTAEGERWVVDYKTSRHEGTGEEAFLDRERERHGPQMSRYARAFGRETPKLALYFPLVPGWREI